MPIAEARIDTDRPSRYLVQICKHAAAMGSGRGHQLRTHTEGISATGRVTIRAEWSDTLGTIMFDPWGTCRLEARDTELLLRVQANSDDSLARIEEIVAKDLGRFSRQELSITWHSIGAELAEKQQIAAKHPNDAAVTPNPVAARGCRATDRRGAPRSGRICARPPT
jgi:hypothetical protein